VKNLIVPCIKPLKKGGDLNEKGGYTLFGGGGVGTGVTGRGTKGSAGKSNGSRRRGGCTTAKGNTHEEKRN